LHLSFYINLPVGGFSAAVILIFFVNQPPERRPSWRQMLIEMDIIGMVLVLGGVTCFVLAMQWGGISKAWNSTDVIGTLVGFGVLLISFVVVEWYQGENAMLHSRIMKRRTIIVGSLFAFL
jgi:MFS transporter, DHA2 family, glioxin efflux transporter